MWRSLSLSLRVVHLLYWVMALGKILNPCSRRIDIVASPVLGVSVNEKTANWTLDCGAEANLMTEDECKRLGVKILPTRQRARMADGESQLQII